MSTHELKFCTPCDDGKVDLHDFAPLYVAERSGVHTIDEAKEYLVMTADQLRHMREAKSQMELSEYDSIAGVTERNYEGRFTRDHEIGMEFGPDENRAEHLKHLSFPEEEDYLNVVRQCQDGIMRCLSLLKSNRDDYPSCITMTGSHVPRYLNIPERVDIDSAATKSVVECDSHLFNPAILACAAKSDCIGVPVGLNKTVRRALVAEANPDPCIAGVLDTSYSSFLINWGSQYVVNAKAALSGKRGMGKLRASRTGQCDWFVGNDQLPSIFGTRDFEECMRRFAADGFSHADNYNSYETMHRKLASLAQDKMPTYYCGLIVNAFSDRLLEDVLHLNRLGLMGPYAAAAIRLLHYELLKEMLLPKLLSIGGRPDRVESASEVMVHASRRMFKCVGRIIAFCAFVNYAACEFSWRQTLTHQVDVEHLAGIQAHGVAYLSATGFALRDILRLDTTLSLQPIFINGRSVFSGRRMALAALASYAEFIRHETKSFSLFYAACRYLSTEGRCPYLKEAATFLFPAIEYMSRIVHDKNIDQSGARNTIRLLIAALPWIALPHSVTMTDTRVSKHGVRHAFEVDATVLEDMHARFTFFIDHTFDNVVVLFARLQSDSDVEVSGKYRYIGRANKKGETLAPELQNAELFNRIFLGAVTEIVGEETESEPADVTGSDGEGQVFA